MLRPNEVSSGITNECALGAQLYSETTGKLNPVYHHTVCCMTSTVNTDG